jgi:bacterioferritin-associated ferredoxin
MESPPGDVVDSRSPVLYACICHAVTTAEVDAAVALGAKSVRQVRKATGAGSACGTCVKRLSCLLAAARVADSAPVEAMPEAERLPAPAPAAQEPAPAAAPGFQHAPHCPAALPALG